MQEIPQNQIDIPVAEVKAEELKLEWGPELGKMFWSGVQEKLAELNKNLEKGEKPWRLPTVDELVAEFKKTGKTPDGFQSNYYWSSTAHENYSDSPYGSGNPYSVGMEFGQKDYEGRAYPKSYVRYVR